MSMSFSEVEHNERCKDISQIFKDRGHVAIHTNTPYHIGRNGREYYGEVDHFSLRLRGNDEIIYWAEYKHCGRKYGVAREQFQRWKEAYLPNNHIKVRALFFWGGNNGEPLHCRRIN